MTRLLATLAGLCLFLTTQAPAATAQQGQNNALAVHMSHLLEGSAEWRSPNPDHQAGSANSPAQFGVNWRWGSNGQHLVGEVTGIYEDGRVARYQSLYAFLNPVTDRVVTQQVGWDGTFHAGDHVLRTEPLAAGDTENVDMIAFTPDGTAKITRHRAEIIDAETHRMDVYERNESGEWTLLREWVWRLAEAD
jgi:hypothetical protein